ncbi:MAG: hypothetical protein V1676_05330 [Candidatus Diapherotrites archaeon]
MKREFSMKPVRMKKIIGYFSGLKDKLPWAKKRRAKERARESTATIEAREQEILKQHLNPENIGRIIGLCKSGEMGKVGQAGMTVLEEVLKGRDAELWGSKGWGNTEIPERLKECKDAYGKMKSYALSKGWLFGEKGAIVDYIEWKTSPSAADFAVIGDNIAYVARDLKNLGYSREEVGKILHEGLSISESFKRMLGKGGNEKIKKIRDEIDLALHYVPWKN